MPKPIVFCDLEGVLAPEMWPYLAAKFGVEELAATTREEPDYRRLLDRRARALRARGMRLAEVCAAVSELKLFDGAASFVSELRSFAHVVVVTDSFAPMNCSFLAEIPADRVLCHQFKTDVEGFISGYRFWNDLGGKHLCMSRYPGAAKAVTFGLGDALNDISMLRAVTAGALFRPSAVTLQAAPDLHVAQSYAEVLGFYMQHVPEREDMQEAVH